MTDTLLEFDPCVTCTTREDCEVAVQSTRVTIRGIVRLADIAMKDNNSDAEVIYGDVDDSRSIQEILVLTQEELRSHDCVYTDEQIKAIIAGDL